MSARGNQTPRGYRRAADALGYDITRCLIVEDAPAGVEAGRLAGAPVLAVTTSHDRGELTLASTVIPDLSACKVERTTDGLLVETTS
jgi:sugar-phosphatase